MKRKSVLLPTQFRRAWWSHAKLSNMCLFASISSRKPEGFASRGCCASSALNPQGPPSPGSAGSIPCRPACQAVFFIPKSEVECARRHQRRARGCCGSARQEADSQFLAPARQCPDPVGMARLPQRVLAKYRGLFFPSQVEFEIILCAVPSPHINPTAAVHQCGVWTEATLPCCCLPNICWCYCIALLWSFPVPPTTEKQYINTENPFNFEHSSYPMLLWPPRKCSKSHYNALASQMIHINSPPMMRAINSPSPVLILLFAPV